MLLLVYTIEENIKLLKLYFGDNSADEVIHLFIPYSLTIKRIIKNFESVRWLQNCQKCLHKSDNDGPAVSRGRIDEEHY